MKRSLEILARLYAIIKRSSQVESLVKPSTTREFTQLLAAWKAGEAGSEERLFNCIYGELRRLAAYHHRREGPDCTLQTTELVHEAYLRLAGNKRVSGTGREHFLSIASRAMRHILVDRARRRKAAKRGGPLFRLPLDSIVLTMESSIDLVELDSALNKLRRLDPREAKVVELRFFTGLTVLEVASALGLSKATVERDWAAARTWLRRELGAGDETIG